MSLFTPKAATNNIRLLFFYGKPNVTKARWLSHHWLRNLKETQNFWKNGRSKQQAKHPSVYAGYDHISYAVFLN